MLIGIDISDRTFALYATESVTEQGVHVTLDRAGMVSFFAQQPPAIVGLEACRAAHHWGRMIASNGHEVRIVPAAYVKPFVRRGKTDANDAVAIVEAMTRAGMSRVAVKSADQQALLVAHRMRQLMVRQRTQLVNAARGHLAEFGIVLASGRRQLLYWFTAQDHSPDTSLPQPLMSAIAVLRSTLATVDKSIADLEAMIRDYYRRSDVARRLGTVPGIGLLGATMLAASFGESHQFRSARNFAAFLGLAPRHRATGGAHWREYMSKRGDPYVRGLLLAGARVCLTWARKKPETATTWAKHLLERKAWRVALVAMANKLARIAWAIMTKGGVYRATVT